MDSNPALAHLRAQGSAQRAIVKKTVTVVSKAKPLSMQRPLSAPPKVSAPPSLNGKRKAIERHAPRHSPTSRPASKEPSHPVERVRTQKQKSSSPAPQPLLSDDEGESEGEDEEQAWKRRRRNNDGVVDPNRRIRDSQAFSEDDHGTLTMIHAVDIANPDIAEHGRTKYGEYFRHLRGEDDEMPIIELQYPSASQREKYQLVRPTDKGDFNPLDEIQANMRCVARHYLDYSDSKRVYVEDNKSSGLCGELNRAAKLGLDHENRRKIEAQHEFIEVVEKYNALLQKRRKDGSLARRLDEMRSVPLALVEHILKDQVYSRVVSPQVHLLHHYKSFSSEVYGELLPTFLSEIFKETGLKSHQVFVDLGSGVGNCVLQAALEVGCESWGCELMENPSKLADLQHREFLARCQLWGLKPGQVKLIHDDFLNNKDLDEVLKRADVILINNEVFTPELNASLKLKFLDLKEHCKIVTLKRYVDEDHEIKSTNMSDPVNVLKVQRKQRFSNRVSWTDRAGDWWIHEKDSSRLQKFVERMSHRA